MSTAIRTICLVNTDNDIGQYPGCLLLPVVTQCSSLANQMLVLWCGDQSVMNHDAPKCTDGIFKWLWKKQWGFT